MKPFQNDNFAAQMKILGVIPSRYGSTRFPGKPLLNLNGKTMIQRVYEQSVKSTAFSYVVVATDDERIYNEVKSFGGEVVMTSSDHQSGTDRCVETLSQMNESFDAVINIQGDEPLINPAQLDLLAFCFNDDDTEIATLCTRIKDPSILFDHSKAKVVLNTNCEAIYFSRHAIPFQMKHHEEWLQHHDYFKHVGIYGYRTDILKELGRLPASSLEKAESLEQLRWLENGYKIKVKVTEFDSIAIDSPDDVNRVLELMPE